MSNISGLKESLTDKCTEVLFLLSIKN